MSNHFYSINRGVDGFNINEITQATTSTTGDDVELRLADAPNMSRKDVYIALQAFMRLFATANVNDGGTNFPPW